MALTTALTVGTLASSYMDDRSRSSANKDAKRNMQGNQQFALQQGNQAQNFLTGAIPGITNAIGSGYQGAANLLGGVAPQQLNALTQGNQAAQNYILAGLPAYQDAVLGRPQNFQYMADTTPRANIGYDPSIFNQKVFGGIA